MKDGDGNLVAATSAPQQGDTVIFDKTISNMSLYPDNYIAPGLQKVVFNANNTIHQGYVSLLGGGEGLVMTFVDNMTWWAGLHVAGTGEVPIDVPSGATFANQKGVRTEGTTKDVTLVKKGAGHFNTACEGGNIYQPLRTKLQGGMLTMRSTDTSVGHEFIFDSNDPDLLLRFCNYVKNDVNNYRDWTIQDGALIESEAVDNTTHGLTSDSSNNHLYYLRLTGTPKLAEQRFTGQLYATAGIAFLPGAKQAGGADYVFTFAKAVSTAGGAIAVTNGTVRLAEGASFTGLQRLDVGATGTFKVESGSGAGFVCVALDIASGGKLDLAAGVRLNFTEAKAGGQALAAGTYTAADADWIDGDGKVVVGAPMVDPIVLSVASGETYLPEALAAHNAATGENVTFASLNGGADKLRTLVKRGAGQLNLTNAMAAFEGAISVEEGILFSNAKNALGKTPNDAHPVFVGTNAQYRCRATGGDWNAGRIFRIQGHGPANAPGALYIQNGTGGSSGIKKVWGLGGMAGKSVVLDGDATLYAGDWVAWSAVTLNGHNLVVRGSNADTPEIFTSIIGDGGIAVTNAALRMGIGGDSLSFTGATRDNMIHIGTDGEFRFVDNVISGATKDKWSLDFAADADAIYGSFNLGRRDEALNTLTIPVTLNGLLTLCCQSDRYIAHLNVEAPVSGPGGFQTATVHQGHYYSSWLRLRAPNTFTGGFKFDNGVIWSYCDGGIPADGGAVQLARAHATYTTRCEYDGVALPKAGVTYSLPELQVSGAYAARVQGGEGAWKKIVKDGAGTLEYYSEVGAPRVEVNAGTFKLPRGAAPGLWEGIATFANAAAAQSAFGASATYTNQIVRGPHMANMRERDNVADWKQNSLVTYTGYIWNRTGETKTWTLASSLRDGVAVFIDGTSVLSGAADALATANVTLTPGPHAFEWRAWNGTDDTVGPYKPSGWADNLGFAYDAQGRGTAAAADFALATDSGDGALFTRATNATERLPAFGTMAFAQGAKLDLNGNAYTANEILGWPTVTNTCEDATSAAALTIAGSFTVDGSDLAVGRQFVSSVPVTFAPGATVSLTNTDAIVRNGQVSFPVFKAAALNWNSSKLKLDGKYWIVKPGADGKSLSLEYTAGTTFILR